MCKNILFLILFLLTLVSNAQAPKRIVNASLLEGQITMDGKLDELVWQQAEKASGFTQFIPQPGNASRQNTEVSILYDNNAVYIGAMLYDHPDSILKQLAPRDEFENNTDAFGVTFDTYFDKQNAYSYIVTAAGVQTDAKMKFDAGDVSWNAAWYSKVHHHDKGWSVEMKIPYSAIRFPKTTIQKWGVNFMRIIRRHRERSFWNIIDPKIQGLVNQSGILDSIHNIKSPIRLAFLPYASTYVENYNGTTAHSLNGGMDIKYGFNESFTLDMTLVPDFGQTRFDNKVLNLSPIEVRYDERRYFFTEGVDLFNKNDLFYSRRVGGTPVNTKTMNAGLDTNEIVSSSPATSKLYNAAKISGRTKNNLGIGFFNAISAPTNATVSDTLKNTERKYQVAPLTNYNVIVLDQALKNNSYISFINTNVNRQENSYNANVSGLLFKFANKANRYAVDGSLDVSQLYKTEKPDMGQRYFFRMAKVSGNYTCELKTRSISDRFNPNDLGYLDRNNIVYYIFNQDYNIYKPFWRINKIENHVGIDYFRVYNPDVFQKFNVDGTNFVLFKSFFAIGGDWAVQPFVTNDYYEPRTPGRVYLYPKNYSGDFFISSDYRKRFALDAMVYYQTFDERNRKTYSWAVSPRFRFSDKFSMIYRFEDQYKTDDMGFVANVNDSIYLGVRNLNTVTNSLQAAFIFTNRMSLKLDARHYWSQANYSEYVFLSNDGHQNKTSYNVNHNVNFNSFNIFMSFVWQFKPGSEMSVVYQNSLFTVGQNMVSNYSADVNKAFNAPQSNSLSVKIIYFLDYLTLTKGRAKKVS